MKYRRKNNNKVVDMNKRIKKRDTVEKLKNKKKEQRGDINEETIVPKRKRIYIFIYNAKLLYMCIK